ncbi:MAG: geranylgeranylglyceryl/heptaprenylglyceryl phosphate synthase [Candidatus Cloacimonetes bacterium]|nr:geranylgeranylglyceryl/heptaprenylglyceryl phosphate synthase [Candidatus Cloacimonadota bacterium]
MKTYNKLLKMAKERANYLCLIDPDKIDEKQAVQYAKTCEENGADGLLVGGSLMLTNNFESNLKVIKGNVNIPVIIFPGIFNFVSKYADAILLLSVVSSRNPQMLIGEQVRAAPQIKQYNLEAIGTAYMLIDSGQNTSVNFMSSSFPIPRTKNDIAVAHALASQYLGMKIIYLDAGSGAEYPVPDDMIREIKKNISLPIILGGGITNPKIAAQKAAAGADFIVTGNILEKNLDSKLIREFANSIHNIKRK